MAKGAVSLSAPEGLGPEGGERVSMAPGLRGLQDRWSHWSPVVAGSAGLCSSWATVPEVGLAGYCKHGRCCGCRLLGSSCCGALRS